MKNFIRTFFEKNELSVLGRFYIYDFIFALFFGLFVPYMTIYFVELGYSFVEVAAFMSVFTIAMVLFEVPTGAFADNYSRKYSVILGFVIMGLGIFPIPLVSNFWLYMGLFIVQAFGMTFISGAEEAWVVDNLKKLKMDNLVDDYYIKIAMIFAFGGIISPIIAAQIVQHLSIDYIWYIFGIGSFISALYAWWFLPELDKPKPSKANTITATTQKTIDGFKYVVNHRVVLYIILGAMFFFVMWAVSDFWQPFLVELELPTYALGYVYSAMSLLNFLFPIVLKALIKVDKYKIMLALTGFKMLLSFAVVAISPSLLPLAISIFVLSGALSEASEPVIGPMLQKQIPSNKRATIMSIYSMAASAAVGVFGLFFGFLADVTSLQTMIVLSGFWGVLAIVFFLKAKGSLQTMPQATNQ